MPLEIEIKFTVPDKAVFEHIHPLRTICGYTTVDRGVTPHTDTYFDTEDFRLYREKIVFRLRKKSKKTVLTFKAQITSADDIYRRIEFEHITDATADDISRGCFPDIPPAAELIKHMGKVKLSPSLTATNNRHTILLARDNVPLYELVLDDVTFSGPGGEKKVRELEVESMTEEFDDLREIGGWLTERFDLKPAGPSKYILGMELVGEVYGL
jgi:inorganic triphosphatase YgiF